MARKRKAYAPFSLTSEAGVAQTPVEGYIDVDQMIYPTVSTGTVNENGKWSGVKSDDEEFIGITKAVEIPNTGETLFPDTGNLNFIDMTGFTDLFIALKPTNGGNCAIGAVMGPDTESFANLTPVNSGSLLQGLTSPDQLAYQNMNNLFNDTAESLTADVWNIFFIGNRLKAQKNLQFKIVNNSGGNSTIEFGFMRLI
jgi:hypothetical protein